MSNEREDDPGMFADIGDLLMNSDIDLDARGPLPDSPRVIRWRDMPAELREAAWLELGDFVEWLIVCYGISTIEIPPCWYQHLPLVEELSALNLAWEAAFDEDTGGGLGPLGWHERMQALRSRLRSHYHGECSRTHTESTPRKVLTDEGWGSWIETN